MHRCGVTPVVSSVLAMLLVGPGRAGIAANAPASSQEPIAAARAPDSAAAALRRSVEEVAAARELGDAARAASALAAGLAVLERCADPLTEELEGLAYALGTDALRSGSHATACSALARVVARRVERMSDDARELNRARLNLGTALRLCGRAAEARPLQEHALALLESAHPDESSLIANARRALAQTCSELGDARAALGLRERVVASLADRPHGDADRVAAEVDLAAALAETGAADAARARLAGLAALPEVELPAAHPARVRIDWILGTIEVDRGDLARGASLLEHARERVPAGDAGFQLEVDANLGVARLLLGDARGALELSESVLRRSIERFGPDHPATHRARNNLVEPLRALGDLPRAQTLSALALAGLERTLPTDHPDVRAARANRALVLRDIGDLPQARTLLEREADSVAGSGRAALDPRLLLALVVAEQGDAALAETCLAAILREAESAADPARLALARSCLAAVIREREPERARVLEEAALATIESLYPANHARVLGARNNLAVTLQLLGRYETARALLADVLAERERVLPADHPDLLISLRNLAWAELRLGGLDASRAIARRLASTLERALAAWSTRLAPRELEERAAGAEDDLSTLLSLALPCGGAADPALARRAFEVVETHRGVWDLHAVRAGGRTATSDSVREAAAELARRAQAGATTAELESARRALDDLQRDERLRVGRDDVVIGADALAARLGTGRALAAFRGYTHCELGTDGAAVETRRLVAFVLRDDGDLARVELGPLASIDAAVEDWRVAVLSAEARGLAAPDAAALEVAAGQALRALVLDPLLPHLAGCTRVVLLLDGALHLAPFDALPLDGEGTPAGTRWSFEVHASARSVGRPLVAPTGDRLVAVGGIDYDAGFDATIPREPGPWEPAFALLPAADAEVQTVALYHERAFGPESARTVLRGASATRAAVESALVGARFVHCATHGWFTAESVRVAPAHAMLDPGSGILASDAREIVRRTSPALMCGLALAGANLPPDASGRTTGRISAEEIATLDLSTCELAVLSACDTNLGVQRSGQGVASLQKALHSAGARQVITASWRVPDDATKELMSDFYRRVWVERKPVRTALWEAKSKLREARDARGQRTHATRDWAGWVLSGGA